jgi:pectin methylesterase-like acyl-CoA thioesterase
MTTAMAMRRRMMIGLAMAMAVMVAAADQRRLQAAADEEDDWIDRVANTSSPAEVQPQEYNTKGFWVHHGSQGHGRGDLEVADLSARHSSFAASSSSSSTPKTIVVAKDGSGSFKTVQAAVNSIPKSNSQRVVIQIKAGIYKSVHRSSLLLLLNHHPPDDLRPNRE